MKSVCLLYGAIGAACLSLPISADDFSKSPNVVLIYADDLGFGDLECYGSSSIETPNINELAASGLRFTNAHSVASTSTPSRYSLLTGEYPWRKEGTDVAAGDAAMIISPDCYTVADLFKDAGYRTAVFGKWHLGLGLVRGKQDWNGTLDASPADLGFDYSYIMAATGDRVPCVFIENGRVANYDSSAPIEVSYVKNFDGEPTGRKNPELLYNLKHSHGHDMSIVNGIGRIGYMRGGGSARWMDENIADSITTRTVKFIAEHKDEPFFIYFATNDVHVPRFPHERFRGKSGMGLRGDAILQFDWSVGCIVNSLKECGLYENTIIILTSDNGAVLDDGYADDAEELVGSHLPNGGLRGGKYSCFEGGTRVPFIVHYPAGITDAKEREGLVSQIDFMAVMADILDVKIPEGAAPDASSDATGYWLGRNNISRKFVAEMAANHTLSIRSDGWKYIEPSNGPAMVPWGPEIETGYLPEPQLYRVANDNRYIDIPADEKETRNMTNEYPEEVERLKKILNTIRK